MHVQQMIATHPHVGGQPNEPLVRAIEALLDCGQACTGCADACLGESQVAELVQCIRACLDCADVCRATAVLASRRSGSDERLMSRMLEVCAQACRMCGEQCEGHAGHMEHCRICADACNGCERACREALESLGAARH